MAHLTHPEEPTTPFKDVWVGAASATWVCAVTGFV